MLVTSVQCAHQHLRIRERLAPSHPNYITNLKIKEPTGRITPHREREREREIQTDNRDRVTEKEAQVSESPSPSPSPRGLT